MKKKIYCNLCCTKMKKLPRKKDASKNTHYFGCVKCDIVREITCCSDKGSCVTFGTLPISLEQYMATVEPETNTVLSNHEEVVKKCEKN